MKADEIWQSAVEVAITGYGLARNPPRLRHGNSIFLFRLTDFSIFQVDFSPCRMLFANKLTSSSSWTSFMIF